MELEARLTRRQFASLAVGGTAATATSLAALARPNVVIFITDQQRYDSLGCYGHPLAKTPNLDRLAATGAQFNHCFCTTPLCSPARASIFSGVYPHRHGIVDNWGKVPSELAPVPGWPSPSRVELPWLGELFMGAGYETAYCGKWHCLTGSRRPGFQEVLSLQGDGADVDRPDQNDFLRYARAKGYDVTKGHSRYVSKGRRRGTSIFKAEDHPDSYVVQQACDYLRRKHDRPFLLGLSVVSPHPPYAPPKPYDTLYDPSAVELPPNVHVFANQRRPIQLRGHPTEWQQARQASLEELRAIWASYLGMVTHVDDLVGKLISTLERTGLRGNTIVVFTSDHGDALGSHRVEDKGSYMYDAVSRVPLLVSYPGILRPQVLEHPVSHVSLLSTMIDFADIKDSVCRDGTSWKPALAEGRELPNTPVYCEYNRFYGEHVPVRAIITERHKYVHYFGPEAELFDRKEDPYEMIDLVNAPNYFEILAQLQAALFRHLIQSNDPFAALLTRDERRLADKA